MVTSTAPAEPRATDAGRVLWQEHHDRVFGDLPLLAPLTDAERRQLVRLLGRVADIG
ncbi:MAG: hypothetical protein M3P85_16715 [Actinomycetota bacterium]|nr:hypothetical protein [Actinomycetota bacterium]